ncbi:hypothetical protein, partial [Yinghuangia sp. YIM S10712]|uniref:hypothetical protein n=1 Tax=Yinghuangia sp. YIM S10712 TaxID=3436930 RepID=UPI003F53B3E7
APGLAAGRTSVGAVEPPSVVVTTVAGGVVREDSFGVAESGEETVAEPGVEPAAEAVAGWLSETDARIPDGLSKRANEKVLLLVAGLGPTSPDGGLPRRRETARRVADEAGRQALAALAPRLADEIAPVHASLRERAAAYLDAERERRLGAVRVLRTNPGSGVEDAGSTAPRAG